MQIQSISIAWLSSDLGQVNALKVNNTDLSSGEHPFIPRIINPVKIKRVSFFLHLAVIIMTGKYLVKICKVKSVDRTYPFDDIYSLGAIGCNPCRFSPSVLKGLNE